MNILGTLGGQTPLYQRIATPRDTVDNFLYYGADNSYPQMVKAVLNLSSLSTSSVNLIANFIRGDGFERGDDVIVNDLGESANDILWSISNDQAIYNGYALHLNSNGLGSVKSVEHIPFEFVRLGLPDQKGRIRDVRVSNNWESTNSQALPNNVENPTRYLIYEAEQNGVEALTTAKGMVYYSTPKKNEYPLSSIDPIIETAQSDNELQKFELGNITNGFLSMSIFKYPSSGDSEEQEEAIRAKLNGLKGAANSNSIIVVGIDDDAENVGNLIEQVPANNNDSLFTNTLSSVRKRIVTNFAVPSGLMGLLPEGSIFSAQQLADEYTYMNLRTKDTRNHIERQMEKLGLDVGRIVPNQFASSQMAENGVTT